MGQLERAAAQLREEATEKAAGTDQFRYVFSAIGDHPFLRNQRRFAGESVLQQDSPHLGEVTVELIGAELRALSSADMAMRWRELTGAVPDALEVGFTSSLMSAGEDINVFNIDPDALEAGRKWLAKPESVKTPEEAGAALFARILLGEDPRGSEAVSRLADLCLKNPPAWGPRAKPEYWHFASLGIFQVGGSRWRAWNKAMKFAILDSQRPDGSWNGEVRATALLSLCLQVYYRYDRWGFIRRG